MVPMSTCLCGSDVHRNPVLRVATAALDWIVDVRHADTAKTLRALWLIVGLALAITLMGVGAGFASGQDRPSPAYYLLARVPGMLPHGLILLGLAIANICGTTATCQRFTETAWRLHRWAGTATMFYTLFCVYTLAQAWALHDSYDAAMWWYALAAALSLALLLLPPPFTGRNHDHREQTVDGHLRA